MNSVSKTVVISGATSGIGLSLVHTFLKEGYNVVGTGRSVERLQEVKTSLQAGERFLGLQADIGLPETSRHVFEQAIAAFGAVDVLVNNAGIFASKPFVQFTSAEMDKHISTNLKGVLYLSQEAARHMSERRQGKIINITAALALLPHSGVPAILAAATKGGINHVTQALALELAPFWVTVNAVAPGVTSTPMHAPETHAAKGALHPLGKSANTADIDQAVLYLARAEFVTGVILPVDGGFSVGK